jgi:hypothetical protein
MGGTPSSEAAHRSYSRPAIGLTFGQASDREERLARCTGGRLATIGEDVEVFEEVFARSAAANEF